MRFALVTADPKHHIRFRIDGEAGDVTSFMQWVHWWNGEHLSYAGVMADGLASLAAYDVVMLSGHPGHLADIITIGAALRDTDTVTMFWPEGAVQLVDNSIHGLHAETYLAWRACDIVSVAEADKVAYYEAFVDPTATLVRFIHVPLTPGMVTGEFWVPRHRKEPFVVVYGDNNPNHPAIAVACARQLGWPVVGVAMDAGKVRVLETIFPNVAVTPMTKLSAHAYLRLLGRSAVHVYPTEWIGTAREPLACAVVGTPCIGSAGSHMQQACWPALAYPIYDIPGMVAAARRLLTEPAWYEVCTQRAFRAAQFYSLELTRGRFMAAVDEARIRKAVRKTMVPA